MSRTEVFLTAAEFLQGGRHVAIVGDPLSGRTHLLGRVRDHFTTLGWHSISFMGIEAAQQSAYSGLAVAGYANWREQRGSTVALAMAALAEQVVPQRTIMLVDDLEWLDDASWAVIGATSRALRVPVVVTKAAQRRRATRLPGGGIEPFFSLRLRAMTYGELETALEAGLGRKIEPSTMSRLFSKSGGNVGIARFLLEAGLNTGRVRNVDGVLTASGPL